MVDDGTRDKFERNWDLEYKMVAGLHGTTRRSFLIWPTFDWNITIIFQTLTLKEAFETAAPLNK